MEIARLKRVYESYRIDPRIYGRWTMDNPGNQVMIEERSAALQSLLKMHGYFPLEGRRVLDIGCGSGAELGWLLSWGASPHNLYGVDLISSRIDDSRNAYPGVNFLCQSAEVLPYEDENFDLILMFTVLSSILDDRMVRQISAEINRLLKRRGALVIYDFRYNNPYNPHVRGVRPQDMQNHFSNYSVYTQMLTLFPPLARRLGRFTLTLYPALNRIIFLRSHFLGMFIKN